MNGEEEIFTSADDFNILSVPFNSNIIELVSKGTGGIEFDFLCVTEKGESVSVDSKTMSYPIFDKMTNRILYEKLDITSFLKEGKNTIVFHIGGGWFCQYESIGELAPHYGDIMLCFKIMQGERQIAESDDRVKYIKSYVRKSNIYYGEEHDARIGNYDFSSTDYCIENWKKAEEIKNSINKVLGGDSWKSILFIIAYNQNIIP